MNIFSTLNQYCTSSPENYLTESFVYLIRELLKREPQVGLTLLNNLCGFSSNIKFCEPDSITCQTQVTETIGIPDIEISEGDRILVFVEVKHDSPLHTGQLEAYQADLSQSKFKEKRLVLLTRSRQSILETTLAPGEFHHFCWYQVNNLLQAFEIKDEVARYLVENFLEFLNEKGMSMNKVSWEYIQGIPSLINLTSMIYAAIQEALPLLDAKIKRTGGWNWRGFYVGEIFCGVRYDVPLTVVFENNGGWRATYKKELDLEKTLFFALNNGEQLELLIKFISESYQEMPKKTETVSAESPSDDGNSKEQPA